MGIQTESGTSAPSSFHHTETPFFSVGGIQNGTTTLLVLAGELDTASAPVLLEYLQLTRADSPPNIRLDLSRLDYVDSSGLSLLVTMHKRARTDGTTFTLSAPREQFLKLLEYAGLEDFFDFDAT